MARTRAERQEHARAMDRLVDSEARKAVDDIERALNNQIEAAARAIRNDKSVEDAINEASIKDVYAKVWSGAAITIAGKVYNAIEKSRKEFSEEQLAKWQNSIDRYIAEEGAQKIALINGTTKKLVQTTVNNIVREATEEGILAKPKVAKMLMEKWNKGTISRSRAERIAQTEVIAAANFSAMEGALEAGMKYKEWLSARDGRVRDSHVEMDGIRIPILESFPNGTQRPGEGGDPAEVINCRCHLLFYPV